MSKKAIETFEHYTKQVGTDEKAAIDSFQAGGYNPECMWRGAGSTYGIKVLIEGVEVCGYVAQHGGEKRWVVFIP